MINGKQLTIKFYVEDLKCSHLKQSVFNDLVRELNEVFCTSKNKLAETKGDINEYLGLTIDFNGRYNANDPDKKRRVIFALYNYIEDTIDSAPPNIGGIAPDPIRSKLFSVYKTPPRLGTVQANFFHSMTTRLLFPAKRARQDIQVAVVYLYTRVREPTENEYLKLAKVIRHLQATVHFPLVIGWDDSGTLLWSTDASFAVHNDTRSHTGAMLPFRRGAVFSQ